MPSHRRSNSESGYTFNPVEALVEDAVGDASELFTDFLDNLLVHVPLDSDMFRSSPVGLPNKRPKSEHMIVGSPVSTMDPLPSMDIDVSVPDSPNSRNNGGGLSRKNKPQRCSICKECGHKSRTCKFAQGAKVADGPMTDGEPSPFFVDQPDNAMSIQFQV
uniref:Uncharacterized protein n=1 Tax=Prymnesium polylepis TaxID=72548 RepID=A0A7S4HH25_9EUKA